MHCGPAFQPHEVLGRRLPASAVGAGVRPECMVGLSVRREAEFLQMLDSPRIVACSDVVDDGRQLVRHDPPRLRPPLIWQQVLESTRMLDCPPLRQQLN